MPEVSELQFYYWLGNIPVFEYYIEGKQYLYIETTKTELTNEN